MNLSASDLAVLSDAAFFLHKSKVHAKVWAQLEALKATLEAQTQPELALQLGVKHLGGRLSRGENHQGFPFRILDYPGVGTGPDSLLLRSLLLWGNHFSVHVILRGKYLSLGQVLFAQASQWKALGFGFCVDADPWQWLNREMTALDSGTPEQLWEQALQKGWLKFSTFLPIAQYNRLEALASNSFELLQASIQQW